SILLDETGRTEGAKVADYFRQQIQDSNLTIEAKSLASNALPAMIIMDEKERRMRDYMLAFDPERSLHFGNKKRVVLNTNHPLIKALNKLGEKHGELSSQIAKEVVDLSMLSQKELDAKALEAFIERTTLILEKLTQIAIKE